MTTPGCLEREGPHEIRILDGCRAENDARGAEGPVRLEALASSHPAADLDPRPERIDDRSDGVSLYGTAFASPLEVDDVQPGNLPSPGARARRRVFVVDGDGVVPALVKAHRLAPQEIDRGDDDHDARNLSSSASPARWLFSG